MEFVHVMLPCITAEVSGKAEKGMTLLCLPLLSAPGIPDPERAIESIVNLAWLIAYISAVDLVEKARLGSVLHKVDIKEEEGEL